MIETERLILRPWRDEDVAPYARILADPQVGDWLGGPLMGGAAERIARFAAALQAGGFGRLALVRRADGALIGHCGLMPIGETLPPAPGVEIGWALAREAWGQGLAREAAEAVLVDAFGRLGLREVVAYTTVGNLRSQAVMTRLGMSRRPERDFDHPAFAPGHPLCRHLVFASEAS